MFAHMSKSVSASPTYFETSPKKYFETFFLFSNLMHDLWDPSNLFTQLFPVAFYSRKSNFLSKASTGVFWAFRNIFLLRLHSLLAPIV